MDNLLNLLSHTEQRPWPLPTDPWFMTQTWHNLLFAHWPVSPDKLRPLIPPSLELDTFGGQAWVGVVAFRISGLRFRGLPPTPLVSSFREINVRTYVTLGGKPGVLFLSMDASNPLAVEVARPWFHIPYLRAYIGMEKSAQGICFTLERRDKRLPEASCSLTYKPVSGVYKSKPGTLEHWLTERYCLYSVSRHKTYRCEIHHVQWPLQRAQACIESNTLGYALGISLPQSEPLLHYAHRMEALFWRPYRVG